MSDRGRLGEPRIASILLYAVLTIIVVACWATLVLPTPSIEAYLGLLILLIALVSLFSDAISGRLGPLSLSFWAFVAVWAGYAPLYQLHAGRLPWADSPIAEIYPWAQLLTLTSVVSYRLGQLTARPCKSRVGLVVAPDVLLGGVVLPLAAFPLAALSGVSLASRFQSRDALIDAYAAQGLEYGVDGGVALGMLKTLPICIAAVGLYLVLSEIKRRRALGQKLSPLLWLGLIVASVSAATFANPLSNSRFQSFSAVLMVVFIVMPFRTELQRILLSSGLLAALLFAYPMSAIFKNETVAQRVTFRPGIFESVDFDGFQQTVNAIWYVQESGHTIGHHLVSAVGFFIPRSVWPGKALPASYPVAAARGYSFQNLSLPLWAELYVEFGVVAMLVALFIIARLSRRADDAFRVGAQSRLAMLTPVLGAVQIGLLRGPLGAQIVFAGTCVALAFILTRPLGSRWLPRLALREVSGRDRARVDRLTSALKKPAKGAHLTKIATKGG